MSRVLVLNATYEPINVCTERRAVVLILKQKAEVIEHDLEHVLHAETQSIRLPVVIRLIVYVRVPRSTRRRITRRLVLARDEWTCQYCGANSRLTVDHVIPRGRGGTHTWENIVTACGPCNQRKADQLPTQAGMRPARAPQPPGPVVYLRAITRRIPPAWTPYIPN